MFVHNASPSAILSGNSRPEEHRAQIAYITGAKVPGRRDAPSFLVVESGQFVEPSIFRFVEESDHVGIPEPMQVAAFVVPANMSVVSAPVVVVADVAGSVHVLNAMDKEPQRE
jgi:hypothetical protein